MLTELKEIGSVHPVCIPQSVVDYTNKGVVVPVCQNALLTEYVMC
jgi:hypothetical protein